MRQVPGACLAVATALESMLQKNLITLAAGLKAAYLLQKQHAKLTLSASAFTMTQNCRTSFYWQRLAFPAGRIPAEDRATSTTDPWHRLVPPYTCAHARIARIARTHTWHTLHTRVHLCVCAARMAHVRGTCAGVQAGGRAWHARKNVWCACMHDGCAWVCVATRCHAY